MLILITSLLILFQSSLVSSNEYQVPGQTFEAKQYTIWNNLKRAGKSRRGEVSVDFKNANGLDDNIHLYRLDLVGNAYERGYAHGYLMANEISDFAVNKLNQFYRQLVQDIDVMSYPEPIQTVLSVFKASGPVAGPTVLKTAMSWTWEQESPFIPQAYSDEIIGIATGLCDSMKASNNNKYCDLEEWQDHIQQLNMLPEIIRMSGTSFGAWGKATNESGLIQLRALDLGRGPFANYTVVTTHHDPAKDTAFVSVGFPGFVGVITGISQSGIGISEKVWVTNEKRSIQAGSYEGEADIFVLRDILENSKTRADAVEYLENIPRAWAMWIGIGDYETQKFELVSYTQLSIENYTDVTAPSKTGQPFLKDVCYADKYQQPSTDGPRGSLPTLLQDFYGTISGESVKTIMKAHRSGDAHIATYDYQENVMYLAVGKVNENGNYGLNGENDDTWKAYNRPYLKFNLEDFWNGR